MATRTSVGSGLWSAAGTWDTGVPANNDVVVIASGHTVEFDVDQSGFADGIDGITVTGTLSLTRTAGTYYMKMKAAKTIGGNGTKDFGSSASPIPFTAKHTVTGGAQWHITSGTFRMYAAEPIYNTVRTTGAAAVGQTRLEIDTDITGDLWAVGDTIAIVDIDKGADAEIRVIDAIAAGYIDITAGLTNAKVSGALIHLITRNVMVQATAGSSGIRWCTLDIGGGCVHAAGGNTAVLFSSGGVISGGVFANAYGGSGYCVQGTGALLTISGGVFTCTEHGFRIDNNNIVVTGGTFSGHRHGGMGYAANAATRQVITGGLFAGNSYGITCYSGTPISNATFLGNSTGIQSGQGNQVVDCTFTGNSNALSLGTGIVDGCVFTGNTYNQNSTYYMLRNCLMNDGVEFQAYTSDAEHVFHASYNHNQVAGAFKAWTAGGITTSVATPVPIGLTSANQMALASATYACHWRQLLLVPAGAKVSMTFWLRKDASMAYLPRVWVFEDGYEPFLDATDIIHTFTMTNSTDTWESETYEYENTATYDKLLAVRFLGKNATGNVYSQLEVESGGGGGGAVRIVPLGKVGL